jgi:hypothetical protein
VRAQGEHLEPSVEQLSNRIGSSNSEQVQQRSIFRTKESSFYKQIGSCSFFLLVLLQEVEADSRDGVTNTEVAFYVARVICSIPEVEGIICFPDGLCDVRSSIFLRSGRLLEYLVQHSWNSYKNSSIASRFLC